MIPHLQPLSAVASADGGAVVKVPPPPRFRGVLKPIISSRLEEGTWNAPAGNTVAQRNGLRYEQRVHNFFEEIWGRSYRRSPLIRFVDGNGPRACIPDGLLLRGPFCIIFEVKFQHMPEAWWQLKRLYQPVVENLYPGVKVGVVEVCRSFDPSTPFPCPVHLIEDILSYVDRPELEPFGVLKWKK